MSSSCSTSYPRSELPYVQAGYGPADDHALDLRGALEDREDLRVSVPALDRVLAGVPVPAEDLDGLLGDPDRGLPRHQLRHRSLRGRERLTLPGHPGRPPGQQTRCVDRGMHVREHERHALILA